MSSIKKLAGETVIYGVGGILPRLVNFLLVASYLTFVLKSGNYGIHAILYSFVTLALVFFTLRMETTFFKFASDKDQDSKHVFNATLSLVLISSVTFGALMLVFNKQIAGLLSTPEDYRYVLYFAGILFLDAISAIPFGKLRLESRPIKFASIKVINSLITAGLVVFSFEILPNVSFLEAYYDPRFVLDYIFIANLIGSIFIVLMLAKEYFGYKFVVDKALTKKMLMYAWPLIIVGIAGSINQFSDRIIISYLEGDGVSKNFDAAGLFTAAIKIAVIMNLFVTAFNYAVEPFFFKNRNVKARESIYGSIALTFTVCATAIFMLVMFFIDFFKLMISEDYHEGLYIVPIALLANLFLGLYYNFSIWYKISNKTIYGALIATCGTAVFLTASFLLIQKHGMIGASIASLVCFSVMCVLAYFLGQKHYPISYPIGKILLYLVLGVSMYFVSDFLIENSTIKMIVGAVLIFTYLGLAYFIDIRKLLKL